MFVVESYSIRDAKMSNEQRSAVIAVSNIASHVNTSNFNSFAAGVIPNLTNLMNSFDEKVRVFVLFLALGVYFSIFLLLFLGFLFVCLFPLLLF